MIRSFTALTIFALLACMALPGFAPDVEASEAAGLARTDRLQVRSVPERCSNEVWPNLSTSCLRITSNGKIVEARAVKIGG